MFSDDFSEPPTKAWLKDRIGQASDFKSLLLLLENDAAELTIQHLAAALKAFRRLLHDFPLNEDSYAQRKKIIAVIFQSYINLFDWRVWEYGSLKLYEVNECLYALKEFGFYMNVPGSDTFNIYLRAADLFFAKLWQFIQEGIHLSEKEVEDNLTLLKNVVSIDPSRILPVTHAHSNTPVTYGHLRNALQESHAKQISTRITYRIFAVKELMDLLEDEKSKGYLSATLFSRALFKLALFKTTFSGAQKACCAWIIENCLSYFTENSNTFDLITISYILNSLNHLYPQLKGSLQKAKPATLLGLNRENREEDDEGKLLLLVDALVQRVRLISSGEEEESSGLKAVSKIAWLLSQWRADARQLSALLTYGGIRKHLLTLVQDAQPEEQFEKEAQTLASFLASLQIIDLSLEMHQISRDDFFANYADVLISPSTPLKLSEIISLFILLRYFNKNEPGRVDNHPKGKNILNGLLLKTSQYATTVQSRNKVLTYAEASQLTNILNNFSDFRCIKLQIETLNLINPLLTLLFKYLENPANTFNSIENNSLLTAIKRVGSNILLSPLNIDLRSYQSLVTCLLERELKQLKNPQTALNLLTVSSDLNAVATFCRWKLKIPAEIISSLLVRIDDLLQVSLAEVNLTIIYTLLTDIQCLEKEWHNLNLTRVKSITALLIQKLDNLLAQRSHHVLAAEKLNKFCFILNAIGYLILHSSIKASKLLQAVIEKLVILSIDSAPSLEINQADVLLNTLKRLHLAIKEKYIPTIYWGFHLRNPLIFKARKVNFSISDAAQAIH